MESIKKPKLLERLSQQEAKKVSVNYCAMNYAKDCCQGKGYLLAPRGPFAHSQLCSCVTSCSSCFGKMAKIVNRQAAPCFLPSPLITTHLLNDAELPARYTYAEFDTFSNRSGSCMSIAREIGEWSKHFHPSDPGLILSGPIGVGKTYVLACILKNFVRRGIRCRFVDFFQLINLIKGAYSDHLSDQAILTPLIDVEVLFIDELGKGRCSDFELTILDQLIMGRYNQGKTIVASTNYPFSKESIPKYEFFLGEESAALFKKGDKKDSNSVFTAIHDYTLSQRLEGRVYSRLIETTRQIEMIGDDYRKKKS